jgi:hypothetical protein
VTIETAVQQNRTMSQKRICTPPSTSSATRPRFSTNWSTPGTREFAELLIDCEEDRILRAVLVGMLREMERR